jgi:hypothetical protein
MAFKHKRDSSEKHDAFFLEFADIIAPTLKQTKTFVIGGSGQWAPWRKRSRSLTALGSPPLHQEPRLCMETLAGNVKVAIMQRPDQSNYALTNVVAGTQMW